MDYGHQRHQAVQIAAMLPEDTADARLVLTLALELVNGFLSGPQPQSQPEPLALVLASSDRSLASISNGIIRSSP